jgi:hypothetical protein
LKEIVIFFSINTFMYALHQGANTSFSKKIFWKQITMNLVMVCYWNENAVFTKHKHVILAWENSWSIALDSWVFKMSKMDP